MTIIIDKTELKQAYKERKYHLKIDEKTEEYEQDVCDKALLSIILKARQQVA